jgi:hypothetical protein
MIGEIMTILTHEHYHHLVWKREPVTPHTGSLLALTPYDEMPLAELSARMALVVMAEHLGHQHGWDAGVHGPVTYCRCGFRAEFNWADAASEEHADEALSIHLLEAGADGLVVHDQISKSVAKLVVKGALDSRRTLNELLDSAKRRPIDPAAPSPA